MIKKLWNKGMNREIISYLLTGGMTTLVNWSVYGLCDLLGIETMVATATAWLVSVLFAFFVNKIFVFQSYDLSLKFVVKEMVSFITCRAASGIMELALMYVMVYVLYLNKYGSKVLVSIVVVIVNYVFSKLFIFKKGKEKPL